MYYFYFYSSYCTILVERVQTKRYNTYKVFFCGAEKMNQTEKKKKAILEVTSNLLRERLISDISMDEIAQLAQVSKVTIFKYYKNKNNLMNIVIRNALNFMIEEIQHLVNTKENFRETFRQVSRFKIKQIHMMTDIFLQNMMNQYATDPNFFDTDMRHIQHLVYQKLFQKGRAEGQISPDYTDEDLILFIDIMSEGMKTIPLERARKRPEILTEMFLNALKKAD